MSNFEEFKQKARDTMETIADKSFEFYKVAEETTKLLAKTTKLSTEIKLEKSSLRRLYREVGEKYYELHKSSPESELEQTCEEVTSTLERIADKKKEIEDLRQAYEAAHQDNVDDPADIEVEIIFNSIDKIGDDDLSDETETSNLTDVDAKLTDSITDTE